ncbi:hypothetical protein BaRGS_00020598 [Batillaria attramentaria]|uniref:Uncharacterized protein n=1 Tax=Batillaria attramentaria TaxID=370345 RepID=A0ABD0KLL7_9CAEN
MQKIHVDKRGDNCKHTYGFFTFSGQSEASVSFTVTSLDSRLGWKVRGFEMIQETEMKPNDKRIAKTPPNIFGGPNLSTDSLWNLRYLANTDNINLNVAQTVPTTGTSGVVSGDVPMTLGCSGCH